MDIQAPADDLPVDDESFDAVLLTQVLEHVPEPGPVLSELRRVLRPGGRLYLTRPARLGAARAALRLLPLHLGGPRAPPPDGGLRERERRAAQRLLLDARPADAEHVARDGTCSATASTTGVRRRPQLLARPRRAGGRARAARRGAQPSAGIRGRGHPPRAAHERRPTRARGSRSSTSLPGSTTGAPTRAPSTGSAGSTATASRRCSSPPSRRRTAASPRSSPTPRRSGPCPDLMAGEQMPSAIFDLISSRGSAGAPRDELAARVRPAAGPRPACRFRRRSWSSSTSRRPTARATSATSPRATATSSDCFSVTSEHLAQAVEEYGVPRDRIRVIHTGVDAEEEFSPDAGLAGGGPRGRPRAHPLPGPAGRPEGSAADGGGGRGAAGPRSPLPDPRGGRGRARAARSGTRVAALGLGSHVLIHPPTRELQRWYAACDLLLMTSVFEGVPYVVFEAMAMGLPVVAPALPGNRELLGETRRAGASRGIRWPPTRRRWPG